MVLFGKGKKDKKNKKDKKLSYWEKRQITKPEEGYTNQTLSVVLFSQKVLDEIAAECLPHAGGSEFQVHYRGLQIKIYDKDNNNRLVFTIPTVFFNMPQTVSTASVEFVLDEIAAISEDTIPISDDIAKVIKRAFPTQYFKEKGFAVVFEEYEMGSLHRHPGNFGFSQTDYDNQVEDPGIIFRTLEAEDKVQVDSVMYIPSGTVKLVTTETRVVNVKPSADGGIEGSYLHAPTISYIIKDKEEKKGFFNFFHVEKEEEAGTEFLVAKDRLYDDMPDIEMVLDILVQGMEYSPQQFVSGDLIKQEFGSSFTTPRANKYSRGNVGGQINHANNLYQDEWEDNSWYNVGWGNESTDDTDGAGGTEDWEDDQSDQSIYPQPTETPVEVKPFASRPSWRKNQTVNRLKTIYKIKIDDEPGISGDASEKDIISIVQILKLRNVEDQEIRRFFREMDYPDNALEIFYKDLA